METSVRFQFHAAFASALLAVFAVDTSTSAEPAPQLLSTSESLLRAAAMAKEVGLSCQVYGMDKLIELGMGARAAIARSQRQ